VSANERIEETATAIVDAAFKVHQTLGPGLLESIYVAALVLELSNRGFQAATQVPIAVAYEGQDLGIGFRADIVVEELVIVEVKSVETIQPVHPKQLLTYLKVTGKKLGLLINFNERVIKNGIRRIANGL
jgi:GxxExxY protein